MTSDEETKQQAILSLAHFDYQKGLSDHAFFKVNNTQTSQDLVQDTFLKTWKYIVKGGEIDVMKSFLYHVLNGLIIDEYRKRKTTSLDVLQEKGFEPSEDNTSRVYNFLDGKKAMTLIPFLPAKYQKVMSMRYKDVLSLKEIAEIAGQTKNTIAVQLHRGLLKLKMMYAPAQECL